MVDTGRRMAGDAGRGGRAIEGRDIMARRRYQSGCLFVRGKRRKMWVARFREDVIKPDGSLGRVIRSEVLGPVSELPKREARKLLESRLRPMNEGRHQPQSTISFAAFTSEHFEAGVLPTFKFSTQQSYSTLLRKHLLPQYGPEQHLQRTKDLVVCPTCLAEKAPASAFTFEYAGQKVHYCGCPYCQEGFQKDPSYYIKRLDGTIPSEGVVGHDGGSVRP